MATITATIRPVMLGVPAAKSQQLGRISLKSSKASSEIGFISSQLSGIKISTIAFERTAPTTISAPFRPSLQPVAREILQFSVL